jgi:hypothetical protein
LVNKQENAEKQDEEDVELSQELSKYSLVGSKIDLILLKKEQADEIDE